MADTKISGLPASTTPLAGTEVLPIVQSGSTVKVAVSDLTAGRAVATGALTVTGAISATGVATLGAATNEGITGQAFTGGSAWCLYSRAITPGATNYALLTNGTTTEINGATNARLTIGGTSIAAATSTALALGVGISLTGGTSGTGYSFSGSAPATSLTLDSSGNLGIGTSSISAKLQVFATSAVEQLLSQNTAASYARFKIANDSTNAFEFIQRGSSATGGLGLTAAAEVLTRNATPLTIFTEAAQPVVFGTSNTERARIDSSGIFRVKGAGTAGSTDAFQVSGSAPASAASLDSSGNLLVGTTSFSYNPTQGATIAGGTIGVICVGHATGTATGNGYANFAYNGGNIGSITQSGTTAVLFNVTSDQRLKENIQDAESASALIDSLQVRQFDWKTDNTHQRYGFIAQELFTVAPEAVHAPADPDEMMAVDYSKLVPMLVKELQSLRARVAQLESKP
jgi:hypothetical protein